jgi:tetratricopeptide (TPR) repeat protein
MMWLNKKSQSLHKLVLIIFISVFCGACANWTAGQTRKKDRSESHARPLDLLYQTPELPAEGVAPKAYHEAVQLLDAKKNTEALAAFDQFVVQHPATEWTMVTVFNSGRALEALGRWSEAAERFHRVIVTAQDLAPHLQIQALYHLIGCYEATGDDNQAVAALLELLAKTQVTHLPPAVERAELPARLAGAYARLGNQAAALKYYQIAKAGIIKVRATAGEKLPQWLGQTLFLMGHVAPETIGEVNLDSVFRVLSQSQVFLLQAAELHQAPWSEKAKVELIRVYRALWTAIESPLETSAPGDELLEKRAQQERRWDLAALVFEKLQELAAYELPSEGEAVVGSEESRAIFTFMQDLEKKINTVLLERPAGEGLTPESLARQARIRGRVLDPDTTLEGQYLRQHETSEQLPATSIPAIKNSAPSKQDPNL